MTANLVLGKSVSFPAFGYLEIKLIRSLTSEINFMEYPELPVFFNQYSKTIFLCCWAVFVQITSFLAIPSPAYQVHLVKRIGRLRCPAHFFSAFVFVQQICLPNHRCWKRKGSDQVLAKRLRFLLQEFCQ